MKLAYTQEDAAVDSHIVGMIGFPTVISVNVLLWFLYFILPDYHLSWVWWSANEFKPPRVKTATSASNVNTSHFLQTTTQSASAALITSSIKIFPDRELDEYWWPSNRSELNFQMIYKNQFPETCEGKQFMVYHLDRLGSRNIGSIMTQVVHWFQEAMVSNRILVFGKEKWEQASECTDQTWECFFQPISSCSWRDIRNYSACEEVRRNHSRNDPWTEENNFECIFLQRSYWRHGGKLVLKTLKSRYHGFTELGFRAYAYAFFFRLNEQMQSQVNSNLKEVLQRHKVRVDRTAVMPIRGSDKCNGHTIKGSAAGEDDCINVEKYVDRLTQYQKAVLPQHPKQIDTIIVTSEDEEKVRQVIQYGKKNGYNVIHNHFDVMQGTGSANDLKGHANTTNFDVMVSVFTNLQLIMRGDYFVEKRHEIKHHSSWHYIMVQMRSWIPECNPGRKLIMPNHFILVQRQLDTRFIGGLHLWDWDHKCESSIPFLCMTFQGPISSIFKNYEDYMTDENLIDDSKT